MKGVEYQFEQSFAFRTQSQVFRSTFPSFSFRFSFRLKKKKKVEKKERLDLEKRAKKQVIIKENVSVKPQRKLPHLIYSGDGLGKQDRKKEGKNYYEITVDKRIPL